MEETRVWDIKFLDESAVIIVNGATTIVRSKSEGSRFLHEYLKKIQSRNGDSDKAMAIWDALCESNLPWQS